MDSSSVGFPSSPSSTNTARRSSGIAVPVSITLHNLLPPGLEDDGKDDDNKYWYRRDHSTDLLVSIQLEIYVQREEEEEQDHRHVLYTQQLEKTSIRSLWDHLQERIPNWKRVWRQESDSIRLDIHLVRSDNHHSKTIVSSFPLHPKLLRRLPDTSNNNTNNNNNDPLCSFLAPNSVWVRYSDGSIRLDPKHYHLLVNKGIISESNTNSNNDSNMSMEQDDTELRFQDKTFDVLDQVSLLLPTTPHKSLLETDDEALAIPVMDENMQHQKQTDLFKMSQQEADQERLESERVELLNLIEQQETLLKQEEEEWMQDRTMLQENVDQIRTLQEETNLIRVETDKLLTTDKNISCTISIYQLKLIKELRQIYPIVQKTGDRFTISNAEIPSQLFSGDVHEDEVSAALGFLSHCIVMMAKYLAIPLRHRILCNSSRSAIQDDANNNNNGSKILPLFLSRVAERSQLERGMLLLHRNADCMALALGVKDYDNGEQQQQPQAMHILAKLDAVYDKVING